MTNFYKRITGSEIQGDASTVVQPAGTLTIDSNNNTLKLHDGSTPGGNDVGGGGGGLTNGWTITPLAMSSQFANVTSIQSGDDSVFASSNGNGYVAVVANEDVYVQTNATAGVDGYTWTYGADGTFNLPLAVNGKGVIQTTSDYYFVASEAIYNLGADGTLTIPGTIATTAGTGDVVINSNDGTHTHTWTFGTDGSLTIPNIIRSTAGQYYAAVSDTSTEMSSQFTWEPSSRVYSGMGNGPDGVWITTTTTDSSSNGIDQNWRFGFDGTTTFPSNKILTNNDLTITVPSGVPTSVANWSGGGGWNQGYYTNLATTGGTGTGLTVDVAANGGGYINISAITIHTPGTGYTDGDVITIVNENSIGGTFTVSVPINNWSFGKNGNTLFPNNTIKQPTDGSLNVGTVGLQPLAGAALAFDRTNNGYLSLSDPINFGFNLFTIEAWVYPQDLGNNCLVGSGAAPGINIYFSGGNTVTVQQGYGVATNWTVSYTANTWVHIAVSSNGEGMNVWVNGQQGTGGQQNSYDFGTPTLTIGASGWNSQYGGNLMRLAQLRIVLNALVYDPNSTSITVPVSELTNITDTVLLLLVSNQGAAYTDTSGNQTVTNSNTTWINASPQSSPVGHNWAFGPDGVLTLPLNGYITAEHTQGGTTLIVAPTGGASVLSNYSGDQQFFAQDDGAYIQAGGSHSWKFGNGGTLELPASGNITTPTGLSIYSTGQTPGGMELGSGNASFYVYNGTVSILTNNQNGQAKSWTWDDTGTITFPQGGTLKVGPIPAHSTGAVGDKAGTVAFGNGYLYYCILDHDNNSPVSYDSNVGENTGQIGYTRLKVMTSGAHPDLTNWTVTGPGITGTVKVTGPSYAEQYGETWFPVDTDFYQSSGTYTFTPPGDIWRRVAWSGDTW